MSAPDPTSPRPADPEDELDDTAQLAQVEHVLAEFRHQEIGPAAGAVPAPFGTEGVRTAAAIAEHERRLMFRRGVRRRVGATVRTVGEVTGRDVGIDLLDASEDGLGIRTRARLPLRAEVTIELSRPGVRCPLTLAGVVRWCGSATDGSFTVGIRLHRRLTPAELANLAG